MHIWFTTFSLDSQSMLGEVMKENTYLINDLLLESSDLKSKKFYFNLVKQTLKLTYQVSKSKILNQMSIAEE